MGFGDERADGGYRESRCLPQVTGFAAEDDPTKLRAELVQVAAVALKMIDALDHGSEGRES